MKNAAKLISNALPKLKIALATLTLDSVLVGVPGEKTDRKEEGMNNATLAYIMEHGSPAANIPARPAIQMGVDSAKDKIIGQLKNTAKATLQTGNKEQVVKGYTRVGLIAQASIRNQIVAGVNPPLATSTLAARRRRGRQGTTPLLDTAQYRNSINFVVRKT